MTTQAGRRAWLPVVAGSGALTLSYGLGVALLATAPVSAPAWALLYLVCLLASLAVPMCGLSRTRAATWCVVAADAALLAAIFYGANAALDVLHGRGRRVNDVALGLGGLELWFVLCPGAVSAALGSGLGAWLRRRADVRPPDACSAGTSPCGRRRPSRS